MSGLLLALSLGGSLPGGVVYSRVTEPVTIVPAARGRKVTWYALDPSREPRSNSGRVFPGLDSILYSPRRIAADGILTLDHRVAGTFLYAWCAEGDRSCPWSHPVSSWRPLHLQDTTRVFQVVVRASDDYPGFVQELMGTPFLLIPRRLPEGHQTDLRIGSDCAALAAYGRRRMGEDVPYLGPAGLLPYLRPVRDGQMRPGDLLHYGEQVQVVLEDRGRKGFSDPEDLVIQSWKPFPRIVRRDSSGWEGHPFRIHRFRADDSGKAPEEGSRDLTSNPEDSSTRSIAPIRGRPRS